MILNNKLIIRIFRKLRTAWTLKPIYWDMQASRISHKLSGACSTTTRKIALGTPFLLLGGMLTTSGTVILGIIAFVPAVLIMSPPVKSRLTQSILVRRLSAHIPMPVSASSARADLLELGIESSTVEGIVSHHEDEKEVLIAEIDQQNRILSHIGAIPSFATFSIDQEKFQKRQRHKVELVMLSGILAIKKTYCDHNSFANELLALTALASLAIVPKLIDVKHKKLILYQTFLPGRNLGSILAEHGITVADQFHYTGNYPGIANWSEKAGTPPERSRLVASIQAVLNPSQMEYLSELLTAIHRAGVAVKDVKYGNIIVGDDQIFMCDFDGAEVFQSNSRRFTRTRELERDKFNYLFGTRLQTTTTQLTKVGDLSCKRDDLLYSPIYYGNGYGTGEIGSVELGSGKWLFIQRALPDLTCKTVLDLGCNNGMLPLEMLRAGARKVTAYELDSTFSMFAQMNHEWFELVDNRAYDFELVQGYMHEVCDRDDLTTYDVATAFCSLYYEEPEKMKQVVRSLSQAVKVFIVQCNENPAEHSGSLLERSSRPYLQALLAENGFPNQQVFAPLYYTRPLIVARP